MHLEQVEEKATRSGKEMSSKRRIRSTISFGKDSIKASACLILVVQKFCEDFLGKGKFAELLILSYFFIVHCCIGGVRESETRLNCARKCATGEGAALRRNSHSNPPRISYGAQIPTHNTQ